MLIIYSDNDEVLVCTAENEAQLIEEYFNDTSREIDDYDREEAPFCVEIQAGARVSIY